MDAVSVVLPRRDPLDGSHEPAEPAISTNEPAAPDRISISTVVTTKMGMSDMLNFFDTRFASTPTRITLPAMPKASSTPKTALSHFCAHQTRRANTE